MAVWQARSALATNKAVKLQVLRGGQTKRDEFTLQHEAFHPVALETKQIGNIAYVKIPYFEKDTAAGHSSNSIMAIAHCLILDRVGLGDQRIRSK